MPNYVEKAGENFKVHLVINGSKKNSQKKFENIFNWIYWGEIG